MRAYTNEPTHMQIVMRAYTTELIQELLQFVYGV